MIARRVFVGSLTGGLLAAPLAVAQQAGRTYRVGTLTTASQAEGAPYIKALEDGLRKLGWVEGRSLAFEHRYADLRPERLRSD